MRLKLATRFSATIAGVLALSMLSSMAALCAAYRVNIRLDETARESMPDVRAEEAEIALLQRSTLLGAFLLDHGNPVWREELRQVQPRFRNWIAAVRGVPFVPEEEEALLRRLEKTWADLDARQEEAVALYNKGEADKAKTLLLTEVSGRLSGEVYDLCGQLIAVNTRYVQRITARARRRVRVTTWVVGASAALTLVLGGMLLWLFFYRVLRPLRGMVADAQLFRADRGDGDKASEEDELRSVGSHFRSLMSDVADTRSRLERSRHRLLTAEKLAAVGKLAAGVAHEIRNPLTAIKMWLFSIQEAIKGDAELDRKFAIVSEEIARLENIIRDFLEFSRPPAPPADRRTWGRSSKRRWSCSGRACRKGRSMLPFSRPAGCPPCWPT